MRRLWPAALVLACSSGLSLRAPEPPAVDAADAQLAGCKVARDPLRPFIVEWAATERATLESASQQGVVAVSYVGCYLKLLSGCRAPGRYALTATTPARDSVQIRSADDLYGRLPLGASTLQAELAAGSQLDFQYVATGRLAFEGAPAAFAGQCEGATHYVRAMTLGAFRLDASARSDAAGGAELGGARATAASKRSTRRLREAGDVDACAGGTADPARCRAVLQLDLAPLDGASSAPFAGFGASLSPLAPLDGPAPIDAAWMKTHLRETDTRRLALVQAARRSEHDTTAPAARRAAAWAQVAAQGGPSELQDEARRRAEAWGEAARAEDERARQLPQIRAAYEADARKLADLLAFDDDVVPPARKAAYRAELDAAYRPWRDALAGIDDGWVRLPAGTLAMGADDGDPDERPVHAVQVAPFELHRTEVTVSAYRACVEAGACTAPQSGDPCNWGAADRDDHPANCVDWDQARRFCAWAGGRLPSEAEWEHAARMGGRDHVYPWGAAAASCAFAVMSDDGVGCGRRSTWPVCSRPAGDSAHGLCDLGGNVWEWIEDAYHTSYAGAPTTSAAWSDGAAGHRVYRGGSLFGGPAALRATNRDRAAPDHRAGGVGFRCAR